MGLSDALSGGILGGKYLGDMGGILPIGGAAAGAAIGGPVGGLIGFGLGSSISSAQDATKAAREANVANIDYARETNATAIELANTAHQREIADLRAAGLNPILSAKFGGSVVPSLSSPKMESFAPTILNSARNTQDIAAGGVSFSLAQQLQKSQVAVNSAQAMKTALEAKTLDAKLPAIQQESALDAEAASHRRSRPKGSNQAGWDVGDFLSTINPFKGWVK